jgi:NhaP-type Na+/H+ or K+/H+ antiporter
MSNASESEIGDTSEQYEVGGGDEEATDVVLAIATALLLGLLIRTVDGLLPRRWKDRSIPFTASVLISGLVTGIVLIYGGSSDDVSTGLRELESIEPAVLFAVFMPALITPSGLTLDFHQVRQTAKYWLTLAVPGTMINAALITIVVRFVLPYSWPWSYSWLLGAILSATDPVSVVSIMEANACDERLKTIINGESLVNDGVAYVLFEVFLGWALGEQVVARDVVAFVFKAVLGGPALGVGFALAVTIWFELLNSDAISVITLSLTAAYSLWTLADVILGVSAVLAVLCYAVFVGLYGKDHIRPGSSQTVFLHLWEWVDWLANALIFFLAGLIIAFEVSNNASDPTRYTITGKDWAMMLSLYLMMIPIRMVGVVILSPVLRSGRLGLGWSDMGVVSWSGLRGAVGLTLSLIVYNGNVADQQFSTLAFFFVGGAAVLSLLIQGSTMGLLLDRLGYTTVSMTKRHLMLQSGELIDQLAIGMMEQAKHSKTFVLLGEPDWSQCDSLSINAAALIQSRFEKDRRGTAEERLGVHEQDLLESLRERLLRAVMSHYRICGSQGFLTPAELSDLTSSVEKASDEVSEPLADWRFLRQALYLPFLEKTAWKRTAARVVSLLLRRRGPLSSLATRPPAILITFILAHAEALRQLSLWVKMEAAAGDPDAGEIDACLQSLQPLQPYWEGAEGLRAPCTTPSEGNQSGTIKAAHSMRHSLVHHLTSSSLLLPEDVMRILKILSDESVVEIERAKDLLDDIRRAQPDDVRDVATQLLSIDILLKQTKMLHLFVDLGLLDGGEAVFMSMDIQNKLRWLF